MLKSLKSYIEEMKLFQPDETILLAVSGGVDSVAMVKLFSMANYRFAIAHSNFGLRGKDSVADENFVRNLAESLNVPFFCRHFETAAYASDHKISIQMAARDLRYAWFDEVLKENGYAYVATAHHLDDQAETFFINLLRGTGLSGLHGILPKQGKVIRPLMFTKRDKILAFALKEKFEWREDRSNSSRKYLRNKLRHDILTEFSKINPKFSSTLNDTVIRLREVESIFNNHIIGVSSDLVQHTPNGDLISIDWFYEYTPHDTYLFELLKPYNFTFAVVKEIVHSLDSISGKIFYSPTHRLLRDRENFIIQPLCDVQAEINDHAIINIDRGFANLQAPIELSFEETQNIAGLTFGNPNTACLDLDKLTFPLSLRKWEKGDKFIPLGSKGKKLLSDFFIDQKLSLSDKNKSWLLVSGNEIIWVVGMRIDNRFRITPKTKTALVVELLGQEPEAESPSGCGLSLLFS